MVNPKYVIEKSGLQFYFNLQAANGEKILTSEMYNSKQAAQKGIASCEINSQDTTSYEKLQAKDMEYYFVLKAKNGEVIGRSEMYTSSSAKENGIRSVVTNGSTSNIEDLS